MIESLGANEEGEPPDEPFGAAEALVGDAVRERATDVHLDPEGRGLRVRMRIDGVMRDPLQAADLARYCSVAIPEQSEGTARLAAAYADSPTAAFHRWFYSQEHEPARRWPKTYDRTPLGPLPPARDLAAIGSVVLNLGFGR